MMLETGKEFFATDKTGNKYRYRFIGIDIFHDSSCRYILLNNLDTKTDTRVEIEWFRHRVITTD